MSANSVVARIMKEVRNEYEKNLTKEDLNAKPINFNYQGGKRTKTRRIRKGRKGLYRA